MGAGMIEANVRLTGHHIIPDHCFYYTSGSGKESCVLSPGYSISDAPVIMLTAEENGGKSLIHGVVHQCFDPYEYQAANANGNQWTYEDAKNCAINSVFTGAACHLSKEDLSSLLDEYFIGHCGLTNDTLIRAGEHGVMTSAPAPRRSDRFK